MAQVSPETLKMWGGYIRCAFLGKTSPELLQVVLQLATRWGQTHVKHKHSWTELGYNAVNWAQIRRSISIFSPTSSSAGRTSMYVLAQVDASGQVIPVGHVMLTEPNRSFPVVYPKPSKIPDSFALWIVECTGGHRPGLVESWYSTNGVIGPVFAVNRDAMSRARQTPVTIAEMR